MKKNAIRYTLLAIGLSASCLTAHAQVLNFTNSTDNNYILSDSYNETLGQEEPISPWNSPTNLIDGYMLTGDINANDLDCADYFKINISGLAGETITSATLNLAMSEPDNQNNEVYALSIAEVDYGSAAFTTADDLNTQSYATAATFTTTGQYLTAPWSIPINVTSEVQSAINAGFQYVTFQLQNLQTPADYQNNYQTWAFNTNPTAGGGTQDLVIDVVPEPTTVPMLIAGSLFLGCVWLRSRRKQLVYWLVAKLGKENHKFVDLESFSSDADKVIR